MNLRQSVERDGKTKQIPLPVFEPEVIIDGSILTIRIDCDKLAEIAVEREGERKDVRTGETVHYVKNGAIMLKLPRKPVEVIQGDALYETAVLFGQGGNGVYVNLAKPKLLGDLKPEVKDAPLAAQSA